MRLIEPMRSGFQGIGPRNGSKSNGKKGYGTGKETLRFKANGNAAVEEQVCVQNQTKFIRLWSFVSFFFFIRVKSNQFTRSVETNFTLFFIFF